jgi:drug/metabolite transporter (DMT)-like permease
MRWLALHQSLLSDLRSRSLPRFAMPERSSKLGDLRKVKPRHRSSSTSRSSARLSGSLTLPFAWHSPTLSELTALIALGFLGGLAHIFLTESYRYAAASVVAPFD